MATKTSTQNIQSFVINKVASAAVFASMVENNQVNENELYLIEGDNNVTYTISRNGGTLTLTGSDGSTSTTTIPVISVNGSTGAVTIDVPAASTADPLVDGVAAAGTATTFARGDHIHPVDTSRAAIASPNFTGVPTAPTATSGTNTTQIATTAFVQTEITNNSTAVEIVRLTS